MNKPNRLVNVRFLWQSNPGTFLTGDLPIKYGQRVVALSDRGMAVGFVNSHLFAPRGPDSEAEYQTISRIASDEDIERFKQLYQKQRDAADIFKTLVAEQKLNMRLADVEYTAFGKKIVFYFTAPTRVDFRELLKDLSKKFQERLELRQISNNGNPVTEGTIGPCGMELCLFINSLMMKQGGRKKSCTEFNCCLDYKDPFYEDKRSRLPKVGDYITTHTGDMGRVEKLDLWREEFDLLTEKGILKRFVSRLLKETIDKRSIEFPTSFERISNETNVTLGLETNNIEKQRMSEGQSAEQIKQNKIFIEKQFELLFGKTSLDFSLPGIDE